jgi:hypothetical protein
MSEKAIDEGAAAEKMKELIRFTQENS